MTMAGASLSRSLAKLAASVSSCAASVVRLPSLVMANRTRQDLGWSSEVTELILRPQTNLAAGAAGQHYPLFADQHETGAGHRNLGIQLDGPMGKHPSLIPIHGMRRLVAAVPSRLSPIWKLINQVNTLTLRSFQAMAQNCGASRKSLFLREGDGTIRRLFGGRVTEHLVTEQPQVSNHRANMVVRNETGELNHVDFQSSNEANFGLRIAEYYIHLVGVHRQHNIQAVLCLGRDHLRMDPGFPPLLWPSASKS